MAYSFTTLDKGIKESQEWLLKEFAGIQAGRATPAILDSIMVESYGTPTAIPHAAAISLLDARTLRVLPWDKSLIKSIEKAIHEAKLPLSVSADADGVRVSFPELTSERRTTIVKILKEKLEEARVSIRKVREAVKSDITEQERAGALSEDDAKRAKDEMEKRVTEGNKKLEELAAKKEAEILA